MLQISRRQLDLLPGKHRRAVILRHVGQLIKASVWRTVWGDRGPEVLMLWEYERKEANDKRLNALLIEKGNDGWELAYAHRGKQTRVNTDPDWWELIFNRPKTTTGRSL